MYERCVEVKDRYQRERHLTCGAWWLIGRFESSSNRHIGTLGKSFTRSCMWRFGVKLGHSIRAVSGAAMRSSGLHETQ